jgi:hypothetical protein
VDQVSGCGRLTHVAIHQKQIALRRKRSGAGHIPRVRNYIETRFEKPTGQPETNAARCTGNHCCLFVVALHGYTDGERAETIREPIALPQNRVTIW